MSGLLIFLDSQNIWGQALEVTIFMVQRAADVPGNLIMLEETQHVKNRVWIYTELYQVPVPGSGIFCLSEATGAALLAFLAWNSSPPSAKPRQAFPVQPLPILLREPAIQPTFTLSIPSLPIHCSREALCTHSPNATRLLRAYPSFGTSLESSLLWKTLPGPAK